MAEVPSSVSDVLVAEARRLDAHGLAPGSSGNLSVRLDDGFLVTPTNVALGRLRAEQVSRLDAAGRLVEGDPPSKEVPLHLAMYAERPDARAVVHLHSTAAAAVSCRSDLDPTDVLPPLTSYYAMKVGRVPLVPWAPPGDPALAEGVRRLAGAHAAVLLANHGPVVAGRSLVTAVDAAEELEEAARVFLLLEGTPTRLLTAEQVARLAP